MQRIASCWLLVTLLAPLAIAAETFLIQSGEDSAPYAFTPANRRGFLNTAYAFTNSQDGQDHSFEYYIRFDLPAALFEPGVQIESAYAWVYYGFDYTVFGDTTDQFGEISCRPVLASWSQATLTWNNRPPVGEIFDGWENVTEKRMYWCDVKELLEDWISGAPNTGIAITSSKPRVMGYHTFEDHAVSPNFRPSLLVETLPEPHGGLLASAALLLLLHYRRSHNPSRKE